MMSNWVRGFWTTVENLDKDISTFNRKLRAWWQNSVPRDDFSKRRRKLAEKDEDRLLFWFFPSAWLWKNFFRR